MGRMADARRRARGTPPAPPPEPAVAPPSDVAPTPAAAVSRERPPAAPAPLTEPPSAGPEAWLAQDEALVFPVENEAAASPGARILLPSSGLAEDILRAVDVPAAPAPEAPHQDASEPGSASRSHSLSFFGGSLREEQEAVEVSEHLVTFLLADEEYGVDVRLVQEIIRVAAITPVPRAPEFIKGVINLRGRIIPVVDLRRKLGLGDVDEASRRARIVVVRLRDRLIGVLVDGASQVLKVPVSVIEAAPEEVLSIAHTFIRGVAKLEKRLIILIALQEILVPELRATAGVEDLASTRLREGT